MKKILTVTVPSYNVEKFLENTLDSFVDERVLDDIEVLIVDDGSKDKTAEIGIECMKVMIGESMKKNIQIRFA